MATPTFNLPKHINDYGIFSQILSLFYKFKKINDEIKAIDCLVMASTLQIHENDLCKIHTLLGIMIVEVEKSVYHFEKAVIFLVICFLFF